MNLYGRRYKYESFRGTFEILEEMTLSFVTSNFKLVAPTIEIIFRENLMKIPESYYSLSESNGTGILTLLNDEYFLLNVVCGDLIRIMGFQRGVYDNSNL